jgi:amino acid transporter
MYSIHQVYFKVYTQQAVISFAIVPILSIVCADVATCLCRNLNYWDSAASFAGEVENPGRAFPRAMAASMVLVILSGALPILVSNCNGVLHWLIWVPPWCW